MRPGPRNLITDVAGLRVGNAADPAFRTGVTVLTADAPFIAAVSVLGGAPGTRETDLLAPDRMVQAVDALVLAGGSAFGLAAASGVADALRAAGRGFPAAGGFRVPIVPAAILYDLDNGGAKDWDANPYPALGAAALAAAGLAAGQTAGAQFALGSAGAGYGAGTWQWKGGLGSASAVLACGTTVGALVAVNALGSVTAGDGPHFHAAPWEFGDEFGGLGPAPCPDPAFAPPLGRRLGEATTIAVVATDAALTKAAAQRIATAAHAGLARAVAPSHTPYDGDLIFAAATGTRAAPTDGGFALGHAAACVLARAIARAVYLAAPMPGDRQPAWAGRFGRGGDARQAPGA